MTRSRQGPVRLLAAAMIAALIGVAVWGATRPIAKRFGVVEPGVLYRSGRLTPQSLERVVEAHGVKTVIDFGADPDGTARNEAEEAKAAELGLRRFALRLEGDGTGDPNMYVEALRVIADPKSGPTLVHCGAGSQRTGAMVALYRAIVQDVALEEGLEEAKKYGYRPRKDVAMKKYLDQWADEIEKAFREGGVITPDGQVVAAGATGSGAEKRGGPQSAAR